MEKYSVGNCKAVVKAKINENEITNEKNLYEIFYMEDEVTEEEILIKLNNSMVSWIFSNLDTNYEYLLEDNTVKVEMGFKHTLDDKVTEIVSIHSIVSDPSDFTEVDLREGVKEALIEWVLEVVETSLEIVEI